MVLAFAGAFDEDDLAPGGFDIEVEVEQEGGGETLQLFATLMQFSSLQTASSASCALFSPLTWL